jgi:DNA polymerase-3 subunit delta'
MDLTFLPWHGDAWARLPRAGDRLPQALLLHGPEGIGKGRFATALAASLLCTARSTTGLACGRCASCHWILAGTHPDFRLVVPPALAAKAGLEEADEAEAATRRDDDDKRKADSLQIGIEQIRSLSGFATLTSSRGGARVTLLHPAESMTLAAANALLKTLEEPSPGGMFLLVSHRPHFLPATVRSRCRPIALGIPSADASLAWLRASGLARPEIPLALAGGAPLLALSEASETQVRARAAFLQAIADPDTALIATADRLRNQPVDILLGLMQRWVHDIALLLAGGDVRYNPDARDALERLARRTTLKRAVRTGRALQQARRLVHHPLNAALHLEGLLLIYRSLFEASAASPR